MAAFLAALIALAELGVLIPGAGVSARCDLRVSPPAGATTEIGSA